MATHWPAHAEDARKSAVVCLESARECFTRTRAVSGPEWRELVADGRAMLAQAALDVRRGRLVKLGHADRWSPGAQARADLAEQTIRFARAKLRDLDQVDDPALAAALLAEIAALCVDAVWYLTAA